MKGSIRFATQEAFPFKCPGRGFVSERSLYSFPFSLKHQTRMDGAHFESNRNHMYPIDPVTPGNYPVLQIPAQPESEGDNSTAQS